MKRKLVAFTTSLMLLLSVLLVGNVSAHPVVLTTPLGELDRSRGEWFGTYGEPPDAGTGMIERDSLNEGEFVFNDALHDQRLITATTDITKAADLDWFAVTGDANNIYFLAKMDRIRGVTLQPTPEVMISIDTDHATSASPDPLPDGVGASVAGDAGWEYVVQTDFTTSNSGATPKLRRSSSGSTTCSGCQAQMVSAIANGSFIEIKVPWNQIGNKPAASGFLRFTASTYYKGHPIPFDGHPTSALIDAASSKTTTAILDQDGGVIKSYFDLHFDANGDVFSPVLISEFQPNPFKTEPGPNGIEWIELYNPNSFAVDLSQYKIGDAAKKGGSSEAMLKFPNSATIAANSLVIVTQDKGVFNQLFPGTPGTIFGQNQLSPYTNWSTGATIGLDNKRDQIMLLAGSGDTDTIADFVDYTYQGSLQTNFVNSTPILFPPAGTPDGNNYSYERCPAASDTNNAATDFLTHDGGIGGNPTPGLPCPPATGVDLGIEQVASSPQVLAGSSVNFTIHWSNNGSGGFHSVVVSDTLPANVTLTGQSSQPTAIFTPSLGLGQPMQWGFKKQTTNVSGTIILTTTVLTSAPANVALVNTAGVQSADSGRVEAPDKLADNVASASVTAIKPDLKVESSWPGGRIQGLDFTYIITATNHGEGDAFSVVVSDTLPANFITFVSSTPVPSTLSGQLLTWNIGDLLAGQSSVMRVTVHLATTAPGNTILTNNITITGAPPDAPTALADNSESKPMVVGVIPDLSVTTNNWPTSNVAPGGQFCYSISYSYSPAGAPATNIVVKDALPEGLTLASQSATGLIFNNATKGDLIWTKASLGASQSGTIQLCVKADANAVSDLTVHNVVTITGLYDSNAGGNNVDTKSLTFDKRRVYVPIIFK